MRKKRKTKKPSFLVKSIEKQPSLVSFVEKKKKSRKAHSVHLVSRISHSKTLEFLKGKLPRKQISMLLMTKWTNVY